MSEKKIQENQDKSNDAATKGTSAPVLKTPEELKAEEIAASKQEALETEQAKIKAAQGESSYIAQPNERHLFHVKLDKPAFSPKDGKKLSKAFIQKFTVQDWRNHEKNGTGLGFTADVLWNPEEYAKS